jgi:hypothetical protein
MSKHRQRRPSKEADHQPYPNWLPLVFLTIICAVVVLIRLNFIHMPFERDEGAYSYYGQLILDGKTPYVDFYETKPPGLFYIYALLELTFGKSVEALHAAGIVLNLLTTIFVFLIGKALMDRSTGVISAASFALLSLAKSISGFTVQAEHSVVLFSVIGAWLLLKALQTEKWPYFFVSGAFVAIAAMIKQNGIFFVACLGITLIAKYVFQKPFLRKLLLRNGIIFTSGIASIVATFTAIIAGQKALPELWKWAYTMPRVYTSQVTLQERMQFFSGRFGNFFHDHPALIVIAIAGCFLTLWNNIRLLKKFFVILFLLLSFAAISPGFWFYNHYFLLLTPALALCVGSAFYTVTSFLAKQTSPGTASLIAAIVFVFILVQNIEANETYYFKPDYTRILREVYGLNPFPEAWEISSVLKNRTKEGDIIGVLGGEPQVFIYTGRRGPSPHDMAILLYGGAGIRSQEWQDAYIADVEKAKPQYFVCFNNQISLWSDVTDPKLFRWFQDYMAKYYELEGIADTVGPFETHYVWDDKVPAYPIKEKDPVVYVFKRKGA